MVKAVGAHLSRKFLLSIGGLIGIKGGAILLFFLLILLIIAGVSSNINQNDSGKMGMGELDFSNASLSPHVLQYKPLVEKYANEEGIGEYTMIILAVMQQESGGNPNSSDPMQSSESLCGRIGCITSPEASIRQGVRHFKSVLDGAGRDLNLALQSYNMGGGLVKYYREKNGDKKFNFDKTVGQYKTSKTVIEFSKYMMTRVSNPGNYRCLRKEARPFGACYGDILYAYSVLRHAGVGEDGDVKNIGKSIIGKKAWVTPHTKRISSNFNPNRFHPVLRVVRPHNGIDLSDGTGQAQVGKPVLSFMDGVVTQSALAGAAGNKITISHAGGFSTVYMHLNSRKVSVGDRVKAGDVIGGLGNTGRSTGAHLHFEIRINGNAVNPMPHIKQFIN